MHTALIPLRELFRTAWRRYTIAFPVTVRLGIALVIIIELLLVLAPNLFAERTALLMPYAVIASCVVIWFSSIFATAMYFATEDEAQMHWQLYYDRAYPYWSKYFLTRLVQGVVTIAGFILFIVPGIIALIRYAVADWVAIFEGLSPLDALKKSSDYVRGRWWSMFGRFLALLFTILPFELLIGMASDATREGSMSALVVQFAADIAMVAFILPWSVAFMNALYNDLRRTEGAIMTAEHTEHV